MKIRKLQTTTGVLQAYNDSGIDWVVSHPEHSTQRFSQKNGWTMKAAIEFYMAALDIKLAPKWSRSEPHFYSSDCGTFDISPLYWGRCEPCEYEVTAWIGDTKKRILKADTVSEAKSKVITWINTHNYLP